MKNKRKNKEIIKKELQDLREKNRKLQETLKAKEKEILELKKWQQFFQGSQWGIAISSKDGKTIHSINPAFAKMYGFEPEELIGKPFSTLFVPHVRTDLKLKLAKVRKGNSQSFESENIRKNGTVFPVQVDVNAVMDDEGKFQYQTFSITDLSETKKKEAEQTHYRNLWDRIQEEIMVIDKDYRIVDINKTFIATFGLSREKIIGHHCFEISHGYNVPCNEMGEDCPLKIVFETGKVSSCIHKHILPNGREIFQDLRLSPVKDESDKVRFVIEAVREITELKKIQESISTQQAFLKTILNNTHDTIIVLNKDLQIVFANSQAETLMDAPVSEIEGTDIRKFLYETDRQTVEERLKKYHKKEKIPACFEIKLISAKGAKRWVEVRAKTFREFTGDTWFIAQLKDITEFHKLAEKLRLEENLFQSLLENIPDCIYFKNKELKYMLINRAHAKLIGEKKPEEATGKSDLDYFDSSFAEKATQTDRKILNTREPLINKHELVVLRDGREKWMATSKVPLTDENGDIIGLVGISRDITDRVLIFNALKQTEEKFRTLFEAAPDGYYLMNMDGEIVDVNRSAELLIGYKKDELIGRYFLDPGFLPKTETTKALKMLERVRKGNPVGPTVFRMIRKDGRPIDIEIRSIPAKIGNEELILGIGRDITFRQQQETQIRKLATVIEQASEYILITDLEGRIEYANPVFEKITGYTREEAIGKLPKFLLSEKHPDSLFQDHLEIVSRGKTWSGTIIKKRKDGSEFYTETTIFPIRNEQGKIINFASVSRDITREKNLERQFHQAQKMEAIGRLAGGVAHDFNNILTVIRGFSDLMLSKIKPDHPFYKEILQIHKASERAANLTNQLLAFSRRQMIQPQVINLNNILRDMERMLFRLIGEDIQLELILDKKLGNIKIDPGQVEQIVMNLVVNARDAMPTGGKITIETSNVYLDQSYVDEHLLIKTGDYIFLAISDTGKGMDEDTRNRIFEPFFTTKKEGSGLGLSTVYGIVKQNDGNIWVYSESGKGTTFKIYFPRIDEPTTFERERELKIDTFRGSETILLVEDDQAVRELAREILAENGYTVLEAENGQVALSVIKQYRQPIHLLLTDVVMPEMSGKELAERIKKIHPEIKILYMSGYTENAITHHGVLANETEFIQKPFPPIIMLEKIRKILQGTQK